MVEVTEEGVIINNWVYPKEEFDVIPEPREEGFIKELKSLFPNIQILFSKYKSKHNNGHFFSYFIILGETKLKFDTPDCYDKIKKIFNGLLGEFWTGNEYKGFKVWQIDQKEDIEQRVHYRI